MGLEILGHLQETVRIIADMAQSRIAVPTQERPDFPRLMVMVDTQMPPTIMAVADSTDLILCVE